MNHETYPSGPEDNSRDNVDVERKRVIDDYERRERKHKEQEDRTVAEPVRSREEILQQSPNRRDDDQGARE